MAQRVLVSHCPRAAARARHAPRSARDPPCTGASCGRHPLGAGRHGRAAAHPRGSALPRCCSGSASRSCSRTSPDPDAQWPVEAGRFRLVAARACPWANRSVIVRRLLGLESAISLALPGPTHDEDSWTFDLDPDGLDPVLRIPRLKDAFLARFPDYPKGITVPDGGRRAERPGGHERPPPPGRGSVLRMGRAPPGGRAEPVAEELRAEMDEVMERVFRSLNAGVYAVGFAKDQASSERAYARDLFQPPGFGDTIDFTQIKHHYYLEPHADRSCAPRSLRLGHAARSRGPRRQPVRGRHGAVGTTGQGADRSRSQPVHRRGRARARLIANTRPSTGDRAHTARGRSPMPGDHSPTASSAPSMPMRSSRRSRSSRLVNSSVMRPLRLPTSMRTGASRRVARRLV